MEQYWYIIALVSAVFVTISNIFKKKTLKHEHSEEFVVLYKVFQAVIILFILSQFINFNLPLWAFIAIYLISLVISLADFYIIKGFRHEEISVVSPLTNLTPLFLLIMAFLFLNEIVGLMHLFGILLLVIGAYVLEAHKHIFDFKKQLKNIIKSRYIIYVIIASFLYGISRTGEKYLTGLATPFTILIFLDIFIAINFLAVYFLKFNHNVNLKEGFRKYGYFIALAAFFTVLADITYFYALSLTLVSLVLPIKRISTLFDTIIGGELFKEKHLLHKGLACLIMLFGIYLIVV